MSDDFFGDFGWEDIGLAGAMAEEMTDEERERMRLELEMEGDDEPRCCNDDES
jgi:hypothetical protein